MRFIKHTLSSLLFFVSLASFAQTEHKNEKRSIAEKIAKENKLSGTEYDNFIKLYSTGILENDLPNNLSDSENKIASACGTTSGINIGFELNNYTDWYFSGGATLRSIPDSVGYSLTAGTKTIISGGTDPVSAVSLTSPLGGLRVIKLNDNIPNAQVASMKTKFKVTPSNSLLKTATSLVFQTANHECKDNPYIKIQVLSCDESIVYHEFYSLRMDGSCGGVNSFAFTGSFTPWHVLCFDLTPYIGQAVVLKVSVGDCVFTGHYGYAYFDATLSPSVPSAISNTITLNGTTYPFNSNFNSSCFNNSVSLTAPSGAATYSWSAWSAGASTQTFTYIPEGYYSIAMTSTNGCTYEKHYLVNLTPTVTAASGGTTFCPGKTYSMTASGSGVFSYSWMPTGLISPTITTSSSASLTHTLIGYNYSKVCSGTATLPITIYPTPTISTSGNASVCVGNSVTLSAGGASTYTWSTGASTSSIVVSPTVNSFYSVYGTNSVGCYIPAQSLSVQAIPTNTNVYAYSTSSFICLGDSVGLSATIGQGAYLWNTGATSYTTYVKPTNTTIYSVSIGSVCPVTRTIQIIVNPPIGNPLTVTSPTSVCPNSNFTVSSTGYSTYSYQFGGPTYFGNPITTTVSSAVTNFTVTGTDAGGCKTSSIIPIYVYPTATTSLSGNTVCAGQNATMTAMGANTYSWSNNLGAVVGTSSVLTVPSGSFASFYWLSGVTSNGCLTNSVLFSIKTDPSTATITPSSFSTCVGGTVALYTNNFNAPTTYTWSTGSNSASIVVSPTVTTTYSLAVNNSVCGILSASQTITVSPFPIPAVFVTAPTTTACANAIVKLTANGANSYVWYNSVVVPTLNVTSSFTGTQIYWVTGTDVNGCKSTSPNYSITYFVNPTVTVSGNNFICPGNSTTLTANGAITYSWSTSSTFNPLVVSPSITSTYSVIGNSNGCTSIASRTVTVVSLPTLTLSTGSPTICPGNLTLLNASSNDGAIFSWSNGSLYDTAYVNPFVTTTYTGTIQGYNGCLYSNTIAVNVTPLPIVTLGASSNTICSYSGVPINLFPSPAGGAYTPASLTTNSLYLSVPGTYTIGYQVNSPCVNKTTASFTVFPTPCVLLSATPDSLCSGQPSVLTFTPSGGTLSGPFLSGNIFTPTAPGSYSVTYNYTDGNGCSNNDCQSIIVNVCTNIKELDLNSISVYPNPFTNEFTINNPNNLELQIIIYDVHGKLISNVSANNSTKINTDSYSNGVYFIRVTSQDSYTLLKMVKL